MLKTSFEILMSLVIFLVMIQVFIFFIRRTFLGKSLIMSYRIIKKLCKYSYLSIKGVYILIDKEVSKLERKQKPKSFKVDKIINLDSYRVKSSK